MYLLETPQPTGWRRARARVFRHFTELSCRSCSASYAREAAAFDIDVRALCRKARPDRPRVMPSRPDARLDHDPRRAAHTGRGLGGTRRFPRLATVESRRDRHARSRRAGHAHPVPISARRPTPVADTGRVYRVDPQRELRLESAASAASYRRTRLRSARTAGAPGSCTASTSRGAGPRFIRGALAGTDQAAHQATNRACTGRRRRRAGTRVRCSESRERRAADHDGHQRAGAETRLASPAEGIYRRRNPARPWDWHDRDGAAAARHPGGRTHRADGP